MEAGVVPLVGVMDSHVAPEVAALKLVLLPLVTDSFWDEGRDPPCW